MQNRNLIFNHEQLIDLLENGEEKLIDKLYFYATKLNYVKYTSTLKEAWRISISGLTAPLVGALKTRNDIPEIGPDEDFQNDSIASFGILEAKKHRNRGITLGMFLGLMKYYRQSYLDLINDAKFENECEHYFLLFTNRFFDRVELGFCSEWISNPQQTIIDNLQKTNREMTNEKNKYLTFFESLPNPAFFVNVENEIINLNNRAAKTFGYSDVPGAKYYSKNSREDVPIWMEEELLRFISSDATVFTFEKKISTISLERDFTVKMKKMLDISGKFNGVIIILNDLTERKIMEKKVKNSEFKYRNAYDRANFYQDIFIHDMNNILHNINLSSSLLLMKQKDSESKIDSLETLEILGEQVKKGASLVATIYKLSKIEEMDVLLKPTEIYKLLSKSIEFVKRNYSTQNIQIRIDTQNKKIKIRANDLLLDLFENIITNAVKYNDNSTVRISIKFTNIRKYNKEFLKLEFKDNGIGISDNMKVDVFQRGSRKEKNIRGMGLGLSLVKKIVDSYNGEIWVEDNIKGDYSKGSNFVVLFPITYTE